MKKTAIVFGSVLAGNWLAERFVLKASPDDSSGFIQVADGPGLDDAARALVIVGVLFVADKATKK